MRRVVIQGKADADSTGTLSTEDIHKTIEYCFNALMHISPNNALIDKLKSVYDLEGNDEIKAKAITDLKKTLTVEESQELKYILGFVEDMFTIDNFTLNSIDGLVPRTERGMLGLEVAQNAAYHR